MALREDEKLRLQADLGDKRFLMLRNHGLLTLGRTIDDAFLSMYIFENTCRVRIDALAGGQPLISIDPQIIACATAAAQAVTLGAGANLAWPALLRRLDRLDPSYKT